MSTKLLTNNLGYPRIGDRRELKKATESYWAGKINHSALLAVATELRQRNWEKQREAGIDLIPSNDFSFYDPVLDMSLLLGNTPARFADLDEDQSDLDQLFNIARGHSAHQDCPGGGCAASEMTKWFDTNYHYIVPRTQRRQRFPTDRRQSHRRVHRSPCPGYPHQARADRPTDLAQAWPNASTPMQKTLTRLPFSIAAPGILRAGKKARQLRSGMDPVRRTCFGTRSQ